MAESVLQFLIFFYSCGRKFAGSDMEEEGKIRVPDLSPINDFSTITKTERRGKFQVCSLGMNS